MLPQVIEAKVQQVLLKRRQKAALKREADGSEAEESTRRFRVIIGSYVEFDDACTIAGPDGRIHKGRGTVVRFNYRHQTWSVQAPQRCETDRMGYVFTPQEEPCWLPVQRQSGISDREFELSFSPKFVRLCKGAQDLAESRQAA
jgi:hypothetical protein